MTIHHASSLIKGEARQSLLGHLPVAVGANILYLGLSVLLSLLASGAAFGTNWLYIVTSNVFLFLIDLLIGTMDYGVCAIYMNLQYRKRAHLADLFCGFRENSFTILKVQAVISAVNLIAAIPTVIASEIYRGTFTEHPAVFVPLYALTIVVALYVDLNYALIWFVLLDYPDLTSREVLRRSRELMKGNKRVLFYIWLTLLPLYLISVLSIGVSALWVLAYQNAVAAAFYRGLMNARRR